MRGRGESLGFRMRGTGFARSWLRLRDFENFYAHPIEGLNAVVDIKTGEVLRVDDHGGPRFR